MTTMNKMIPQYATKLFCDIWDSVDKFLDDYHTIGEGIPNKITDDNAKVLFYLLYSKYGNNPIANYDEMQFKFKVMSIIWQYGPTWQKRLEIQDNLRSMSEDELMSGAKQIYNHAMNPGNLPSTASLEELDYINDQNTSNYKRGKLEAYGTLWEILKVDVTNEFLNKFLICFKKFAEPARTYIYVTEEDE